MSPELLTAGMFGLLLVFILAGVSLAFALGSVAVIFVVIMNGLNGLNVQYVQYVLNVLYVMYVLYVHYVHYVTALRASRLMRGDSILVFAILSFLVFLDDLSGAPTAIAVVVLISSVL